MSDMCSNMLYAATGNANNHARILTFINENFKNRTVDFDDESIDAEFESVTSFPLQKFTELTGTLEPDEDLLIKVLSTTFPGEYVTFHVFENGEWTTSELAQPSRHVQAKVLFGYEAVQAYFSTGVLPSQAQLETEYAKIITLSFESESELRGYTRFLEENAADDVAIIEVVSEKCSSIEIEVLLGAQAVGYYEEKGCLPTKEQLSKLNGNFLIKTFRNLREKEVYAEGLRDGSGWEDNAVIETKK